MGYKQLTQEQRYQIYALKQAEQKSRRIAEIIEYTQVPSAES